MTRAIMRPIMRPIMRLLSVGKYRALQRASTPQGHFTILALDHQDALRRSMRPDAPAAVTPGELTAFKIQVVGALVSETSGVLLDPIYGAAQAINGGILGNAGLLVELEKADYQLQPMPLETELLPDWSVAKIKRMGADGVKLFYYTNPDSESLVAAQDRLVEAVSADCAAYDIPLYAEPILTPVGEDEGTYDQKYTRRVLQAALRAAKAGVDVLKLEFPLPPSLQTNDGLCRTTCAKLTETLDVPWVLLSAGVSFDAFCRQVEIACAAGASGYIAGRAVWSDAAAIADHNERQGWLEATGRERLRRLAAIAAKGRPWTAVAACEPTSVTWYRTYAAEAT